jgi:hypothetical protein
VQKNYIGLDIHSEWIVLKYRKKVLDAKFHGRIQEEEEEEEEERRRRKKKRRTRRRRRRRRLVCFI